MQDALNLGQSHGAKLAHLIGQKSLKSLIDNNLAMVQIKENGVKRHLGHFDCEYQAYLTYQKELLRVESISGLGDKKLAEIYQPIFDLFFNEYNLTLTLSEMDEIIQVSKKVTESMEKLLILEKL